MDSCQAAGRFGSVGLESVEILTYFEYVLSCRRPRKPDNTRASVRMPIPFAYSYGSRTVVEGLEAERVVRMTPAVTSKTEIIWVFVYL